MQSNLNLSITKCTKCSRLVKFRKKISDFHKINIKVISYNGESNQELIDLAFEAGINSRFKLDPKLSPFLTTYGISIPAPPGIFNFFPTNKRLGFEILLYA